MEEEIFDVVIVGAGISGLSAAYLLHQQHDELKTVVLEARDRVGGRTHTLENNEVKYVDLGGSYVGPTQNRILRMAKHFGIETYKVYAEGKDTEHFGGKMSSFDGDYSTWNIFAILDYYAQIRKLDSMCDQVPLISPWQAEWAKEWDTITAKEYFDKSCWTDYAKKRMYQVFHDAMAVEPYDMSLLYYLWYLKSAGGVCRIADVENAGQERKFMGGSQQISKKMANVLGDKVILSSPVCSIEQKFDQTIVRCLNGKYYKTRYVISAIPHALLRSISFSPPLSALKNQLIQKMPMGSVIKTITYYEDAWWRDQGFSGVLIANSDSGPVYVTLDDSKPDGSYPALMGFIVGEQARFWCKKSGEERKQAVCEQYAKAFNTNKAKTPRYYIDKNWPAEKYSGGCYVSVLPCGVLTSYGEAWRSAEGNCYFAGTETATTWAGYMDGAVESGERAAREVLYAMKKISKDEIYQEEPASEDVPPVPCSLTPLQLCLPSVPTFMTMLTVLSFASMFSVAYLKRS
ncbi:amine oxidase [flavin-containing] B-like [Dendronephthya gigantea]|uniref:amine oxidase [flavin-containing] B-like n=1 Tax=Dendronephthya gigantea TaxID=151771 RepID=UPI00106A48CD|nr:amine oxidase [flavin-containing] B-like [Dendronephthya gigantea]